MNIQLNCFHLETIISIVYGTMSISRQYYVLCSGCNNMVMITSINIVCYCLFCKENDGCLTRTRINPSHKYFLYLFRNLRTQIVGVLSYTLPFYTDLLIYDKLA